MSLNTTPRTWVAAETVTAAEMNAEIRDAITGIQASWTTYTPTWTSTGTAPAVGNGTITGRYLRMGKTMLSCEIILTLGSTSTVGTGGYTFSLPLTLLNGTLGLSAGSATFMDSSAGSACLTRVACRNSTTSVAIFDAAGARVGAATPVVPATGDIITATLHSLELA